MFKFITLLRRFAPPYKKYVFLTLLFNLLTMIFSLFSFATVIPILQLLFNLQKGNKVYMPWTWNNSWHDIFEAVKNNLSWWVEHTIHSVGPSNALLLLGVFLVFTTALKVGTAYLGSHFLIPIRTGVLRDLRNQLYRKIIRLPIGFFTEERKGDIISRMTSDVGEVEASIMSSLDMIFKNPILITGYLGIMFYVSWKLTIFVLFLLPVSGWLIGKIGKSLKRRSTTGQEQTGELLTQIEETLTGLRIIKAFNAEHKMEHRFGQLNETIRKTFNRLNRRYNLAHPVSELLGTVVIAILIWYGGSLILSNQSDITAEGFIFYILTFYSIINPAKDLSKAGYSIQKGYASLERVDKILMSDDLIHNPENPIKPEPFREKLEIKNLCFRYSPDLDLVLKNIEISIPKGQTIALVGQSGSGKSTLADLIPRYYDPTDGQILLDGHDLREFTTHDLRSYLGYVNQEPILFNDTFFNNIAFGVENATMEEVIEAARIANAHDFIIASENGYETTIGDRGNKLSGGQRQRISIARAVLKNPPILLLDEATSSLDTESEKMVQDALEHLMQNRTTLVVAHRLSTISKADKIYVMNEGRIVESGRHEELIALNGYYKRLCDMQTF